MKEKPFAGLKTLVAMQLKEKLDFSFNADRKKALTKLVLFAVMAIAIMGVLTAIFIVLSRLSIFAYSAVPIAVFNTFFIFMFLLSIISCASQLTENIYFAEDNQVLLTYPVKPDTVFFSKLIVYYVADLVKNAFFMVPLFVAYGIAHSFVWYYYPWMLFCFVFISMIPVAVSGLISVPLMWIKLYAKKFPLVQTILTLLLLIGLTVATALLIQFIPKRMDIASEWESYYKIMILNGCRAFNAFFLPFTFLTTMMMGDRSSGSILSKPPIFTGMTAVYFFSLIGILAVLLVATYFLVKPLFFRMASTPFEIKKKNIVLDFTVSKETFKQNVYPKFITIKDMKEDMSKEEKEKLVNKLKKLMEQVKKEEVLFYHHKVSYKRVIRLLEKYTDLKFEVKNFEEAKAPCFAVSHKFDTLTLILVIGSTARNVACYDPVHTVKPNKTKTPLLTSLVKDVSIDLRTPGEIVKSYILIVAAPIIILLLNSFFNAMTLKAEGFKLVPTVNALMILLVFLGSNVEMTSIYSKEGKTAYLIKASPVNYLVSLFSKLVIRATVMAISLVLTAIFYQRYVKYYGFPTPIYLGIAVFAIYIAHLIWSAELDYMNPQDKLYAETGNAKTVNNPNETTSMIIAIIISFVAALLIYVYAGETITYAAALKLMIIAILFLGFRIYLFTSKVFAYSTSRGERGKD